MFDLPQELEELKMINNWVCYRLEPRPTKADPDHLGKIPYNPATGGMAKANDPGTWSDYETAVKAAESGKYDGIGFELGNSGYCGIDLDHCVTDGRPDATAARIARELNSYTEYSISGTGLHIIARSAPMDRAGYNAPKQGGIDLEVYRPTEKRGGAFLGEVEGGRYLTISGRVYGEPQPIADRTAAIKSLVKQYWPPEKKPLPVGSDMFSGFETVGSDDSDRRMLQSAIDMINAADLDFSEWAAVISAMKALGFPPSDAEAWSARGGNPKHVSGYVFKRWEKFHLPNRDDSGAGGVIINIAKDFGWSAADTFTEDERREYGRRLHQKDYADYDLEINEDGVILQRSDNGEDPEGEQLAAGRPDLSPVGSDDQMRAANLQAERAVLITPEEWEANGYYTAEISVKVDLNDKKHRKVNCLGYEKYLYSFEYVQEKGLHIIDQVFLTKEQCFPGLVTYKAAVNEFETVNEKFLMLRAFPELSTRAKIKLHDTVVIAADTGAGKSSLAINFIDQLNDDYPVLYINLEMDHITILRRLVSIRSGITLDQIEGYQQDDQTAETVNAALGELADRKPLQILDDVYSLETIEKEIKNTVKRSKEPIIVIIDHALLIKPNKRTVSRYERFTEISEELRRISRQNDVIMFVLMQQNRSGKSNENERPTNASLKESGSWENDATHILFLWWDPDISSKRLIMTKNRNGKLGEIILNYWPETQKYRESVAQMESSFSIGGRRRRGRRGSGMNLLEGFQELEDTENQFEILGTRHETKRAQEREKLRAAIEHVKSEADAAGEPVTVYALAEYMDISQRRVINLIKEYGGYHVEKDGKTIVSGEVDLSKTVTIVDAGEDPDQED